MAEHPDPVTERVASSVGWRSISVSDTVAPRVSARARSRSRVPVSNHENVTSTIVDPRSRMYWHTAPLYGRTTSWARRLSCTDESASIPHRSST